MPRLQLSGGSFTGEDRFRAIRQRRRPLFDAERGTDRVGFGKFNRTRERRKKVTNEMKYMIPSALSNLFAGGANSRTNIEQAKSLAADARKAAAAGRAEREFALTAKTSADEARSKDQRGAFAAIAAWHFQRSAEKYGEAAAMLEAILGLSLSARNLEYVKARRARFEEKAQIIRAEGQEAAAAR
jgi:hypothetical protein